MNRTARSGRIVDKIEDTIRLTHSVDIKPVHPQQLQQQRAIERIAGDVIQIDTGGRVIVPNVQSEILLTEPKRLHRVNVFHHGSPKRSLRSIAQTQLRDAGFEHLQNERTRSGIPILG